MAVLLDTDLLAPESRADAYRAAMLATSGSTRVELEATPTGVSSRMQLWSFGESRIFTCASTGVSMVRDARAAQGASPEYVAIGVHGVGMGHHETATRQRVVRTGDVMVVDVTRPFSFAWSGQGSSTSLQVPLAELGMSRDVVQRATHRLESSPLYRLVSRYLVELTRNADTLSASPSAPALGEASTHLVRALLAGAAGERGSPARDVVEETLLSQVRVYVRQHLRDPELDADSVAAALAVSRRQIFRVCARARASFSLEQYIIDERLEGAKAELASPLGRARTITSVALAWGFKDPTHFTRRFRAAYGLLPSDWRRIAVEERGT
jgi:AraC-like DNA-binding protein